MEQRIQQKQELTKDENTQGKVSISRSEAMEYREYKRQRKRAEILSAIANSEGILTGMGDAKRVSEKAVRLRQAAVRMTAERLEQAGEFFFQHSVKVDCIVGGSGETVAKVKAYEAKIANKLRAREITLMLSPFFVKTCRFGELRKEMKRVRRAAKKTPLKVSVDKEYPLETLKGVAKLCGEVGAQYFCVPYFNGCELLRYNLTGGCKLQVSGVETLDCYKKLVNAGVGRIVTDYAWEIYAEWLKEVEKINFPELMSEPQQAKGELVKQEQGKNEPPTGKETKVNAVKTALEKDGEPPKKQPLPPPTAPAPTPTPTPDPMPKKQEEPNQTPRIPNTEPERETDMPVLPTPLPSGTPPSIEVKNAETNYRCVLVGKELKFY